MTDRLHRPLDKYVRISWDWMPPRHHGIDFSCGTGTPLFAPLAGRAYANSEPQGFGDYIRIEPEAGQPLAGHKVYLAHMSKFEVGGGQRVAAGSRVGLSGNTGNSTGPHLHLELRRNAGSPYRHGAIDPWLYIDWHWNVLEEHMSKLGVHFQLLPSWHVNVVNQGRVQWVKMIDPTGPYPYSRKVNVIGRLWTGGDQIDQAMIDRREAGADIYFEQNLPRYRQAPWVTVWEGPNEPLPFWDKMQNLNAFSLQWVRRMHDAGLKCAVGGFSVGRPDTGTIHLVGQAIQMADFWHLHEYSQPTMQTDQSWLCLRYRRAVEELRQAGFRPPPLLITELGLDGGAVTPQRKHEEQPRKGWKTFATWAQYQGQIVWYAKEIAKDPYVVTATPFVSGAVDHPEDGWLDFDLDESKTRWVANYALTQPTPLPAPPPTPPAPRPLPSNDPQVRDAIEKHVLYDMYQKARWWREEAVRKLEAGQVEYAHAILLDMVDHTHGLDYIIERGLRPRG